MNMKIGRDNEGMHRREKKVGVNEEAVEGR